MIQEIYKVDDLSNGLEKNKLAVVNKYNYDHLVPFEYISSVELSSDNELKDLLAIRENFCKCSISNCADQDQCSCDGKKIFCCSRCSCIHHPETNCSKRYLPLNCSYQVYYVNPQKKWGLRTLAPIKKGSILFEYAGILSEDKDGIDDDDYIFLFDYQDKKYIIDAHKKGNLARFVNHSCASNCYTDVSVIDDTNVPHLLIIAGRDIIQGEELTLDYGQSWWTIKMNKTKLYCSCDSDNCQYLMPSDQDGINGEDHVDTENGYGESLNGRPKQTATKALTGYFCSGSRSKQMATRSLHICSGSRPKQMARKAAIPEYFFSQSGSRPKQSARKAIQPLRHIIASRCARKVPATQLIHSAPFTLSARKQVSNIDTDEIPTLMDDSDEEESDTTIDLDDDDDDQVVENEKKSPSPNNS